MTPEQIAQIATQAAIAAVQAMGAATAAPVTPVAAAVELPPDPEDEAAAAETISENEARIKSIDGLAEQLVSEIMQPRHAEVFDWCARSRGVSRAELFRQVVRSFVASETPNWRESKGMGGGSTKSAETMSRLKGE